MPPIRTKLVKLDEDSRPIRIGSLTLDQVEQITKAEDGSLEAGRYWMIETALNNALDEGEEKWTELRINKEFDIVSIALISEAILKFSGLEKKDTKADSPGEPPAVSKI